MKTGKARANFLGKNGKLHNCAEAVAAAFGQEEPAHVGHGSGRAPDGWCGAAYAAAQLCKDPESVEKTFTEVAGSVKCREIRRTKKLDCAACVDLGEAIVHSMDKNTENNHVETEKNSAKP